MRYNIPATRSKSPSPIISDENENEDDIQAGDPNPLDHKDADEELSVGKLFVLLEENKKKLGLEFYSVSPSTFDEVFLRVIEKHNIKEEDTPSRKMKWYQYLKMFLPFFLI